MEKQVIGNPFPGELKALYLSPARRTVEQCYHALKRKYKANGLAVPPTGGGKKNDRCYSRTGYCADAGGKYHATT